MANEGTVVENPIILNILTSYGAILIGSYFSCIIWGASCVQVFYYFFTYDKDHWGIKLLVAFVWCLDTANQILIMKAAFPVLILQWGRVAGQTESQSDLIHHVWVAGIVAVAVQMFFLWRIHIFSGRKWLFPVLMLPPVWWQTIGTIPFAITTLRNPDLSVILEPAPLGISKSLRAASCGVDIILAVAMSYLLIKNGKSHFTASKKLVFRLSILSVNSGLWTAISALLILILVLIFPQDLLFCIFDFPLSGLYVNTLMGNLNARRYLRGTQGNEWNSYGTPNLNANVPLSTFRRGQESHQDNSMMIRVETSQAVKGDEDYSQPDNASSKVARIW